MNTRTEQGLRVYTPHNIVDVTMPLDKVVRACKWSYGDTPDITINQLELLIDDDTGLPIDERELGTIWKGRV